MMKHHLLRFFTLSMLMLTLSGCFMREPNKLFSLPKQAEDYFNLQQAIDEVMVDAVYSAPINGENRQPVQLKDLDGDGNNEAILFAKTEGEHPLKIYVFHREGSLFSQIACLEGDGVNFDTVQFVQIDAAEGLEMVVSRQLNDSVPQTLCVYAANGKSVAELLNINVFRFAVTDLDQDEVDDVFVLHSDAAQHEAIAGFYSWKNGQMYADSQPLMGTAVENVLSLQTGKIEDGIPAVFVTGSLNESTQSTAVLITKEHKLVNVLGADHMLSIPVGWTVADVDFDGKMEIPELLKLDFADQITIDGLNLVRWKGLNADGTERTKTVNVHNTLEQWQYSVPEAWQDGLCVRLTVADTCRRLTLCKQTKKEITELLTILADTDADALSAIDGIVLLGSKGNMTYAAQIPASDQTLTPDVVMARFELMQEQTSALN